MSARSEDRQPWEREKVDFDQTIEAVRRIKKQELRSKLAIAVILGWLLGVIMVCAYLGVQPLW